MRSSQSCCCCGREWTHAAHLSLLVSPEPEGLGWFAVHLLSESCVAAMVDTFSSSCLDPTREKLCVTWLVAAREKFKPVKCRVYARCFNCCTTVKQPMYQSKQRQ